MQEIKKTRIVIASVLKPVDDTRMYEKIGESLANQSEVHIIGFPSIRTPENKSITFHPSKRFNRLSLSRILAAWHVAWKLIHIRPSVIIITTHELLLAGIVAKLVCSAKLVYDIQENYYRNIAYTDTFPPVIRFALALHVRFKEKVTSIAIDHFILAEAGYEKELTFLSSRKTIIENKLRRPGDLIQSPNKKATSLNLLFTGTLAETTGVFDAIHLAESLHQCNSNIKLTIAGYAARHDVLAKIRAQIDSKSFITLVGGDKLVPHSAIIELIRRSDFGIIAYPRHRATENAVPTKLYEYLGFTLPILLVSHEPWMSICRPFEAAVTFDLHSIDPAKILDGMKNQLFYTTVPQNVFWDSEEPKLKNVVSSLI